MKTIIFDFNTIRDMDDFYARLQQALPLPSYFGNNLDALFDVITGDWAMPLEIRLIHLSQVQKKQFSGLIATFEDAAAQIKGFFFSLINKEG